jgi:hypothetical protein
MLNRRKLLGSSLAAPAMLTFPRLAGAVCTPRGLGPTCTAPGSLPSLTTLNNPFVLNNGTAITTKLQWQQRRAEMKQLVQYYMMGHAPPPVPVTVVGTTDTVITASGGTMTPRAVNLSAACPGGPLSFSMNMYIPTAGAPRFPGPYPVLMGSDMSWSPVAGTVDAVHDAAIGNNAVQALVARGFIIAEFGRDDFSQDSSDFPGNFTIIFSSAAYTLFPYDVDGITGYDWGMHRAQAWGFSRAIDYLVTQAVVDNTKICVAGHSRGGVAATLAGCFDERIAITCSNQGGIACLYRYSDFFNPVVNDVGGTLDMQVAVTGAPGWYNKRLHNFIGNTATNTGGSTALLSGPVEKLPFDWHQIMGLIAPRGFITNNGINVVHCCPVSTTQALVAARQIWTALGVGTGNTGSWYTNIDTYHTGTGGHEFTNSSWTSFVNWMDFVFFGSALPADGTGATPSHSYFIPYAGLTKPYSWSTPILA